jgi:hypothetical protein
MLVVTRDFDLAPSAPTISFRSFTREVARSIRTQIRFR